MKKALIILGSILAALVIAVTVINLTLPAPAKEAPLTSRQLLVNHMNDEIEPDVASVRYDEKADTAVVVIHDGEDYMLCSYAEIVAYDSIRQGITAAQESKLGLKKLTIIYKIQGTDNLGNDTGWATAARMTFNKKVIANASTDNMTDEMVLNAATNARILNYAELCG
jgi:hypothetical protein